MVGVYGSFAINVLFTCEDPEDVIKVVDSETFNGEEGSYII